MSSKAQVMKLDCRQRRILFYTCNFEQQVIYITVQGNGHLRIYVGGAKLYFANDQNELEELPQVGNNGDLLEFFKSRAGVDYDGAVTLMEVSAQMYLMMRRPALVAEPNPKKFAAASLQP